MEINKNARAQLEDLDVFELARIGGIRDHLALTPASAGAEYLRRVRRELLAYVDDWEKSAYATPDAGEIADKAMEHITLAAADEAWTIFSELHLWTTSAADDAIQMHDSEHCSPLAESALECFARDLAHKLAQELLADVSSPAALYWADHEDLDGQRCPTSGQPISAEDRAELMEAPDDTPECRTGCGRGYVEQRSA